MCGIVGWFERGRPASPQHKAAVARGVDVMHHRGPDDAFAEEIAHGAWGMCRLAIRDPSHGRQPLTGAGVSVVFNGEIYNTDELRDRLRGRGHRIATTCDTEVVLTSYLEWGAAAFSLFDGIFAIAIVDERRRRLVLARDEFGVKPLFVRSTPSEVAFASEPKALRPLGALRDGPDVARLVDVLRYQHVPEPHSPWRNVRRVARGTYEQYDLDTLVPSGVGRFDQPAVDLGDGDWVERTDRALRLSVSRQMISDRPLGVFLSGGIDSTIVSAYASELHPGLRAFGVSVPWERDERRWMEAACARLDVDLTVAELTQADIDRMAARALDTYDEPFADYSSIPTMLVSEVAGKELRVVLSGDGGDELFAGYERYGSAGAAESVALLPPSLARGAARVARRVGLGGWRVLERVADSAAEQAHGYSGVISLQSHAQAAALLGLDPLPGHAYAGRRRRRDAGVGRTAGIDVAMAVDRDQYLPGDILTKVDRATMAASLEARVPLLGAPVARLSDAMPTSVKRRGGVGKWPLKELLRRRGFDDEFLHRRKTGFGFPIEEWLRGAVGRDSDLQDRLRRPPEPLDAGACGAVLDELMAGAPNGHQVWALLQLSQWLAAESVAS